jgi:short-subunit dehydrogenase
MLDVADRDGLRFDMLLNVAGVDFEGGFLGRERENLVKIVLLNDAATLRITHAVLERRRPGGHFTVVFVSSLASMFPMPLKATYAASKRFLLDFAVSLRQELKSRNANALVLCPGGMVTTKEAMEGIAAQGFWGGATTNPLEVVARRTLDHALKGKGIYVPGALNRVLSFFGKIVPSSCAAALIYRRWSRAQSKWLPQAAPREAR